MKKLLFLLLSAAPAMTVFAQFKPVGTKSTVFFSIKNFGIPVSGNFTGLEGSVVFDPAHPELAMFRVSVKSATVNTGNELRDNHLKNEGYFDAEHFPLISFSSSRIEKGKDGMLVAYGALTIKNHTRQIAIPFSTTATAGGYLFKGQCIINRKDFEVGGNSLIADNATITLAVTLIKQ